VQRAPGTGATAQSRTERVRRSRFLWNAVEKIERIESPTLADVIQSILSRPAQTGQSGISRSIYNLKEASKMLNFLTDNKITDRAGLEKKVRSMYSKQDDIRVGLKFIERRLKVLDEHIKESAYHLVFREIYQKYKQLKPRKQKKFFEDHRREIMLFESADRYFTEHINRHTVLPIKQWREERDRLTAEKNRLYLEYNALSGEVREVELIRRSVYEIMRQEQNRSQPTRARGREW